MKSRSSEVPVLRLFQFFILIFSVAVVSNVQADRDHIKSLKIYDGRDSIRGGRVPQLRSAQEEWRMACTAWQERIKNSLKKFEILIVSCGAPACQESNGRNQCVSAGHYRFRDPSRPLSIRQPTSRKSR